MPVRYELVEEVVSLILVRGITPGTSTRFATNLRIASATSRNGFYRKPKQKRPRPRVLPELRLVARTFRTRERGVCFGPSTEKILLGRLFSLLTLEEILPFIHEFLHFIDHRERLLESKVAAGLLVLHLLQLVG